MDAWVIVFLTTLAYLLITLAIGLASGRNVSNTPEGYVAGDRSLGFLLLYFIMGASIYSAFAFLGAPGWAYSRGAAAFYIVSYGTVGLLPWYFLGPRIAILGRRFGFVTQAEFFAYRFDSPKAIPAIMAIMSAAALVPYLVIQMKGAGYVFSVVTEGRMPEWAGAALAYGVVLIYVARSGVMGVGWTNTFQGILMLGLAWGLGLYLPWKLHGGIGPMFRELAATAPEMLVAPGLDAAGEPWGFGAYSSAVVISVLGFSVWPHYFMKIYAARSVRTLKRMVIFYPTFQIFLIPVLFIGFAGIMTYPGVEQADTILPTILMDLDLPAITVGLFCAGALAASMSSGDAILHAGASVLVKDLEMPLRGVRRSPAAETRLIRWTALGMGSLAYYLAVGSEASLVSLLLMSYGAIAQFFPLMIAAMFWRRATREGAIYGLLAGCAVTLALNVWPDLALLGVHPGIYGALANVAVMVLVSRRTDPPPPERIEPYMMRAASGTVGVQAGIAAGDGETRIAASR